MERNAMAVEPDHVRSEGMGMLLRWRGSLFRLQKNLFLWLILILWNIPWSEPDGSDYA